MNLFRHGRPIRFDTACLALLVQHCLFSQELELQASCWSLWLATMHFSLQKSCQSQMGLNKNIFYTEIGLSIIFFLLFFVFLKMSASQVKTPRTECTLISLATAGLTVTSCYSCLSSYYCFKGPPAGCNNIQGAERYRILLYKLKAFLLSVGSHLQSSSSNAVNMEV